MRFHPRKQINSIRAGFYTCIFATLLTFSPASGLLYSTDDQKLFYEEVEAICEDSVATFVLGLHGELITPQRGPMYNRGTFYAHIIANPDERSYDLMSFIYPHIYVYARIDAAGNIAYDFGNMPGVIDTEHFYGPTSLPLDSHNRLEMITKTSKLSVFSNTSGMTIPTIEVKDVLGTAYRCADGGIIAIPNSTLMSPRGLFIIRKSDSSICIVDPAEAFNPYVTIESSGWLHPRIIFRRKVSGESMRCPVIADWPFLEPPGKPSFDDRKVLQLTTRTAIVENWPIYDASGRVVGIKSDYVD